VQAGRCEAQEHPTFAIYIGANTWLSRCCVRAKDVRFGGSAHAVSESRMLKLDRY